MKEEIKIEEFRTKKFKEVIKKIAEDDTYELWPRKEIKFYTGNNGVLKSRNLIMYETNEYKRIEDIIAVYYVNIGNIGWPKAVTYNDYKKYIRDAKVCVLLDEENDIDKAIKISKTPILDFKVGDKIWVGNYLIREEHKVIKRTKCYLHTSISKKHNYKNEQIEFRFHVKDGVWSDRFNNKVFESQITKEEWDEMESEYYKKSHIKREKLIKEYGDKAHLYNGYNLYKIQVYPYN